MSDRVAGKPLTSGAGERLRLRLSQQVVKEVVQMSDWDLATHLRREVDPTRKSQFLNALLLEAAARINPAPTLDEGEVEVINL